MTSATTDLFKKVSAGTVTQLALDKALAATSITVGTTANMPTTTGIVIAIRTVDTSGNLVAGTYTEYSATVSSGTTLAIVATPVYGNDQVYLAGSTTQVFVPTSAYAQNTLIDGILVSHNQDGTVKDAVITNATFDANLKAGWQLMIAAGTRVGNTSFTVVGDVTDRIAVGDKIKLTDTTTKFFYVTAVAYTSSTLITVTGGSDYLVVGNPSNIYYSHGNAVGFPGWFNYTPTGISATNVALSGRFTLNNRTCKTNIYALFSGAITFTTMPTLPITASQSIIGTGQEIATKGTGSYTDTGASDNPNAISPTILASATVVNIRRSTDAVALSASVPITWANNDKFIVYFDYEI